MALGYMRRHRRYLFIFLWLVIAAFIILYIPAFQGADKGTPGETLGRVGEQPITVGEFQKKYLELRRTYDRMYQGRMDPAILRSLRLEEQAFQALVIDRVILLEAERLGVSVESEALAQAVQASPEFQAGGASEIRRRLELQGISVAEFELSLHEQLLRQRLEELVTAGITVSDEEAEREFRERTEQVRAEYVLVDFARFESEISPDEARVAAHFDSHKETYRVPEKRVLSYALIDRAALQAEISIEDRDINVYYGNNREEFLQEEEVCASHILVKVSQTPDAAEGHPDEEARQIAQGLLDRIRAGEDLATLAEQFSEDKGSAPGGGDLGCFPRGRMVPQFENEAFVLEPGEVSELIKSPFGYHIILQNSLEEETVTPLAEVRERIRMILVDQRARAQADDQARRISGAMRAGRTLAEAVAEEALVVQRSEPISKGEPVAPLASPPLVARAFGLEPRQAASEPFPLATGYAFIELAEVLPSRLPELEEVEERVTADVVREEALDRAAELAGQIKERAQSRGLERAAAAEDLEARQTPTLVGRGQPLGDLGSSALVDDVAFSLPEETLSDPVRVDAGYAVLRILEKKPYDPVAYGAQKTNLAASLREQKKQQFFQAYMLQVRERFPVERNPEAFQRVTG